MQNFWEAASDTDPTGSQANKTMSQAGRGIGAYRTHPLLLLDGRLRSSSRGERPYQGPGACTKGPPVAIHFGLRRPSPVDQDTYPLRRCRCGDASLAR